MIDLRTFIQCALAAVFVTACVTRFNTHPVPPDVSRSSVLQVHSKAPIVAFDVFEPGEDGTLHMPPLTADLSRRSLNGDGISTIKIGDEEKIHVADVSQQASGISNNDLDMQSAVQKSPKLTDSNLKALDWLKTHQIDIGHDAIVWDYTFDLTFNNIVVKAPWPSAFAQADVIKALMLAARRSGDASYLTLARKAAYAFTVPCEQGGLNCRVGGVSWFEEVPVPFGYAPMILNGHLYATIMLDRLLKETDDPRVKSARDEGVSSARSMLLRYDTGYWTIYQIRPRILDVTFNIDSVDEPVELERVVVSSAFSSPSVLVLGRGATKTSPNNRSSASSKDASMDGAVPVSRRTVWMAPGRMSIDHDPVHFEGFDVEVKYAADKCDHAQFSTFDLRSTEIGPVAIPDGSTKREGADCIAKFRMANSINQWSQLTPFYHDWHCRLVTELFQITRDPLFYTTAVRWWQYAAEQKRPKPSSSAHQVYRPIFAPNTSPDDDEAVAQALAGLEPRDASAHTIAEKLTGWAQLHRLGEDRTRALLMRAGIPQGI